MNAKITWFCLGVLLSAPFAFANPKSAQHKVGNHQGTERERSIFRSTVAENDEGRLLRKVFNHPLQQWRENIITTVFYVGEYKKSRVGLLNNRSSSWISNWVKSFGGVDHPNRSTVFPTKFKPRENPFYFALPLSDKALQSVKNNDILPEFQEIVIFFHRIYSANSHARSFLKNTWIAIECDGKICYAQWQDVGPYHIADPDYVLKNEKPKNEGGRGPALDVSPAVQKYLTMNAKAVTRWRFVPPTEVPSGPWKKIVSGDEPGHLASR
jgi:hypothetical protein